MNYAKHKVIYVVGDLKQIGPTNQTLNIIRFSESIRNCLVITLFEESEDTQINDYIGYGIKVECLHLSRKMALVIGVKRLREKLRECNGSIIHSWGTIADILTHYACKKLSVKHVITLRNFPIEEMTTRMNKNVGLAVAKFDLHILKNCKHVITCSKSIKMKMENSYHWKHLTSIQNGVDFTKFHRENRESARRELGVKDEIVFIATGSMIPRKRIDETADSFILAKKHVPMQLWFLGDGNLLDQMKKKYSSHKEIKFFGKKSNVSHYLSAADVFVSSSESEGMPNAVLEAISCMLPIYVSDIPQHKEIFESVKGCGLAYKLGCREELASLFEKTTKETIQKMSKKTTELLSSDLTMENMGKAYEKYYDRVINDGDTI